LAFSNSCRNTRSLLFDSSGTDNFNYYNNTDFYNTKRYKNFIDSKPYVTEYYNKADYCDTNNYNNTNYC
jgi:hypothetical protein